MEGLILKGNYGLQSNTDSASFLILVIMDSMCNVFRVMFSIKNYQCNVSQLKKDVMIQNWPITNKFRIDKQHAVNKN